MVSVASRHDDADIAGTLAARVHGSLAEEFGMQGQMVPVVLLAGSPATPIARAVRDAPVVGDRRCPFELLASAPDIVMPLGIAVGPDRDGRPEWRSSLIQAEALPYPARS